MTFYDQEQSLCLIEGFLDVKYDNGKHKKGWKTRFVSLHSPKGEDTKYATRAILIIYEKNDFANRSDVYLSAVTSIRRVHLRRRPFAFTIECLDGTTASINPGSETGSQKWMQIFRSVIYNVKAPPFIVTDPESDQDIPKADENDNSIFQDCFPVAIIDNQDSIDLGISAYYVLKVSLASLSLLDIQCHVTVEQWPLRYIERFSIPATLEEDRNHLLSIHVVREATNKTYSFYVEDALKILGLIRDVIAKKLGQPSEGMSFGTLQYLMKVKQDINKKQSLQRKPSSVSEATDLEPEVIKTQDSCSVEIEKDNESLSETFASQNLCKAGPAGEIESSLQPHVIEASERQSENDIVLQGASAHISTSPEYGLTEPLKNFQTSASSCISHEHSPSKRIHISTPTAITMGPHQEKVTPNSKLLRQKPLTIKRKNAPRNRAHTLSSHLNRVEMTQCERRARSMNDTSSDQPQSSSGTPNTISKFNKKQKKASASPRKSQFYVALKEAEDIPLRRSWTPEHHKGYLHMKHKSTPHPNWTLSLPKSTESSTDSVDMTNEAQFHNFKTARDYNGINGSPKLRSKSKFDISRQYSESPLPQSRVTNPPDINIRAHSLPESECSEWIVPEEITIPKTAAKSGSDSIFPNEALCRRISTTSNIYYDLVPIVDRNEDANTLRDQDDVIRTPEKAKLDSSDTEKYKKNLSKFLGIPPEIDDPLSTPPSLPARPKTLPKTPKKNEVEERLSLPDTAIQTSTREKNVVSATSNNDHHKIETPNISKSISAIPHLLPLSFWPISSMDVDSKSKKVESQNQLYNNATNIYVNQDIHNAQTYENTQEIDHVYADLHDNIDLKQHAKSLVDLLWDIEHDSEEISKGTSHSFSVHDLRPQNSILQESQIYENIGLPLVPSQASLESSVSYHTDSSRATPTNLYDPESSVDSIYLRMDQLHIDSNFSTPNTTEKVSNKDCVLNIDHKLSQNLTSDQDGIYMDMGPFSKSLPFDSEDIYENVPKRL